MLRFGRSVLRQPQICLQEGSSDESLQPCRSNPKFPTTFVTGSRLQRIIRDSVFHTAIFVCLGATVGGFGVPPFKVPGCMGLLPKVPLSRNGTKFPTAPKPVNPKALNPPKKPLNPKAQNILIPCIALRIIGALLASASRHLSYDVSHPWLVVRSYIGACRIRIGFWGRV